MLIGASLVSERAQANKKKKSRSADTFRPWQPASACSLLRGVTCLARSYEEINVSEPSMLEMSWNVDDARAAGALADQSRCANMSPYSACSTENAASQSEASARGHPFVRGETKLASHNWAEPVATRREMVEAFLRCLFPNGTELEAKISRIEGHSLEHIDFEAFNIDLDVLRLPEFLRQVVEGGNRHFERVRPALAFVIWRLCQSNRHPVSPACCKRARCKR